MRRMQAHTARTPADKIVRKGEQFMLGGNETYISLCRKHYKEGKLGKEEE